MAKQNLFNSIKLTKPKKNFFDLTHDVKMSMDMGNLVPILTLECVPGDKFTISCESLIRFAPLIAPVMHRMDVSIHYFFVPNRILWDMWEEWIVEPILGIAAPVIKIDGSESAAERRFLDYMGIPPFPASGGTPQHVSCLPMAAYQKVYQEYYRDQNLVLADDIELLEGENFVLKPNLLKMHKRAWEHDYFTAALPWAQKGDAVDIPLGTVELVIPPITTAPGFVNLGTGTALADGALSTSGGSGTPTAGGVQGAYDPRGSLEVGSTTVNDLRRAFRLQEWLERNARAGTRYVENILAHFGVKSSDARLQRPEYITGVKSPVIVSEVLNTTGETAGLPQGNMSGHAVGVVSGKYGNYYCEEHGYIIGIMSVMPKPAYQQGIPRHYNKFFDPLEYFWPSFANIGEQAVQRREIFAYTASPNDPFGYVPRYSEYKYMANRVAGDFRTSLDYWHLGRIFATPPALNQAFIECNPDKRIFAVDDPSQDSLYVHVLNKISAIRPMPKFGNPSF